jgi:signal transduction histidine kinase
MALGPDGALGLLEEIDRMKPIGRLSLRWKIPGLIALILVAAVVTLWALAYGAARRSAIELAHERLQYAAHRVSGALTGGIVAMKSRAEAAAADTNLLVALRTPLAEPTAAAERALRDMLPESTATAMLVDHLGRPLLATTEAPRPALPPVEKLKLINQPTVGPFMNRNNDLVYTLTVPVRDSGRIVGHVVQSRRVMRATTSISLIADLLGDGANLLIGNADGSVVTDMSDTARAPVPRDSAMARQARERYTQVSAAIEGTPWAWSVEYPYDLVFGSLTVFSWKAVLVALGVVLVALVAGDLLSRGISRPIAQLTTVAESIAGGDLTRRPVPIERQDEVGRLARSFHTMADSVRHSQVELERRIEERTAELRSAMTELRETQDELVRKERLAMLGQLSSSVGHELRNPLGVMSNSVYILERALEDPPPKVQDCLRILRNQIQLSERIVSDLLDSVRGKAPQRRAVAVDQLISDQMARVTIPESIRVRVDVPVNLPGLHADPDQVGQILVNLFNNAVQAMNGSAGELSVRAMNGDGRIKIEVSDTGPGVPPDIAEKIFEPLYTTKARGIGLGLSVSRSLAEVNSGTLSVMNHSAGGAVFLIDLPAGGTT